MFEVYILPVLIFVVLGLVAGLLLSFASAYLGVKTDEKVEAVRGALPGINCGACGFSGCDDYAKAVAGGEKTNLCVPGGGKTAQDLAAIMGTEAEDVEKNVAVVRCNGVHGATGKKYEYTGTPSCAGANKYYSGDGQCPYGCLGYGDCTHACIFDALHVIDGVAYVDPEKCTGCGQCAQECPKGLIDIKPLSKPVVVICASQQNGKNTRAACTNGCIGCRKCEKTCPYDAVHVDNFLARIDYEKCTACGKCVEVCPVSCIHHCY